MDRARGARIPGSVRYNRPSGGDGYGGHSNGLTPGRVMTNAVGWSGLLLFIVVASNGNPQATGHVGAVAFVVWAAVFVAAPLLDDRFARRDRPGGPIDPSDEELAHLRSLHASGVLSDKELAAKVTLVLGRAPKPER